MSVRVVLFHLFICDARWQSALFKAVEEVNTLLKPFLIQQKHKVSNKQL